MRRHLYLMALLFCLLPFSVLANFSANRTPPRIDVGGGQPVSRPLYKRSDAPIGQRVRDLVARMTLEEKVQLLGGTGYTTMPNTRLGIPALKMTDGPLGVRTGRATAFPSGVSMGASFNRNLVQQVVSAMGVETRAAGQDVLLGPCVGLSRVPLGGRNFESFGEDPYLTAELAAHYVRGLNEQKVVGSVKHFALNDEEYMREVVNSVADERTMHELHLVAFERAIKEGVGSVMASYNRVNGFWASENPTLLTSILKQKWGFSGFVVSDWGATHSTVAAALAGLDLEMPTGAFFNTKLVQAVNDELVPEELINDKVTRILTQIFTAGLFDGADTARPDLSQINSPAHQALALEMARESIVLLKNENSLLPLDLNRVRHIAVIGPNADVAVAGGGSSKVETFYSVSPYAGLRNRIGNRANVEVAAVGQRTGPLIPPTQLIPAKGEGGGLYAEYYNNADLAGEPTFTRVDPEIGFFWNDGQSPDSRINGTNYSIRWSGSFVSPWTGEYVMQTDSDDGVRLWLDDRLIIDNWTRHGPTLDQATVRLEAGKSYKIRLEYFQGTGWGYIRLTGTIPPAQLVAEAMKMARKADVVVLALGTNSESESEGHDRETFALAPEQQWLFKEVAKVNPNIVVVLNSGNAIEMDSWLGSAKAVLHAWFAGQEGGHALADILLGNYNPSGRLPISLLKRWEDSPSYDTYPEVNGDVVYKEGIYLGYRYHDKFGVAPQFPFGFGLSYTSFVYENLDVKRISGSAEAPEFELALSVKNIGSRAGAEVVQLYVEDRSPKVDRPVQELKDFAKIYLEPGQVQTVKFRLGHRSFAYYDVNSHSWQAKPGRFKVNVGASSRDIRLAREVILD